MLLTARASASATTTGTTTAMNMESPATARAPGAPIYPLDPLSAAPAPALADAQAEDAGLDDEDDDVERKRAEQLQVPMDEEEDDKRGVLRGSHSHDNPRVHTTSRAHTLLHTTTGNTAAAATAANTLLYPTSTSSSSRTPTLSSSSHNIIFNHQPPPLPLSLSPNIRTSQYSQSSHLLLHRRLSDFTPMASATTSYNTRTNSSPSSSFLNNHTRPHTSPHISSTTPLLSTTNTPSITQHINPLVHNTSLAQTVPSNQWVSPQTTSSPLVTTDTHAFATGSSVSITSGGNHTQPQTPPPQVLSSSTPAASGLYTNITPVSIGASSNTARPILHRHTTSDPSSANSSPYRSSGWVPNTDSAQWYQSNITNTSPSIAADKQLSNSTSVMQLNPLTGSRQKEPIIKPGEQIAVKPNLSYAALIGEALLLAPPPHNLYVAEISESIKSRYLCESPFVISLLLCRNI